MKLAIGVVMYRRKSVFRSRDCLLSVIQTGIEPFSDLGDFGWDISLRARRVRFGAFDFKLGHGRPVATAPAADAFRSLDLKRMIGTSGRFTLIASVDLRLNFKSVFVLLLRLRRFFSEDSFVLGATASSLFGLLALSFFGAD